MKPSPQPGTLPSSTHRHRRRCKTQPEPQQSRAHSAPGARTVLPAPRGAEPRREAPHQPSVQPANPGATSRCKPRRAHTQPPRPRSPCTLSPRAPSTLATKAATYQIIVLPAPGAQHLPPAGRPGRGGAGLAGPGQGSPGRRGAGRAGGAAQGRPPAAAVAPISPPPPPSRCTCLRRSARRAA